MGGSDSRFESTPWSLVFNARTLDDTRRRVLLENLTRTYWKPVYCYLRKKGYPNDTAKDLTQGFFCEIVLGKDLIQKADQAKGKFRTLLLTALERYLVSQLRYEGRLKRGGQASKLPLDDPNFTHLEPIESVSDPDQAFYYVWITKLLDEVLLDIRTEYERTDRHAHWQAFSLRLLNPILQGQSPQGLPEICDQIGVEDPAKVSNMIETVKRRFRSVLKRHLRHLTSTEEEAEEEFLDILTFLAKHGAR